MTITTEPVPPHHGDARARVLKEVAPRVGQLRAQAALHPDAHVDCALVRETIALLQSLLPVRPEADKRAQVDMAADHNDRADALDRQLTTTDQINDLSVIRRALFSGQKSTAKFEAQESFGRLAKQFADLGLLNTWIVTPAEQGKVGGLMYRVWDTGQGQVVVDLSNDHDAQPFAEFQAGTAIKALSAAADYLSKVSP